MAKPTKRRLIAKHRRTLFLFATTVFVDADLRKEEDHLLEEMRKIYLADHAREVKPHAEVFKKFNLDSNITHCLLPEIVPAPIDGKQFTLPNGDVVERENQFENLIYQAREFGFLADYDIKNYLAGKMTWRSQGPKLTFEESITIPRRWASYVTAEKSTLPSGEVEINLLVGGVRVEWLSRKFIDTMIRYYRAHQMRIEAEDKLCRAIGAVIYQVRTFEELLEFWPEAQVKENELGFNLPPHKALIMLSNEDKDLLCAHMGQRGVSAAVCQVTP